MSDHANAGLNAFASDAKQQYIIILNVDVFH